MVKRRDMKSAHEDAVLRQCIIIFYLYFPFINTLIIVKIKIIKKRVTIMAKTIARPFPAWVFRA